MWEPTAVIERIKRGELLPDSMFGDLDPDALLTERDYSFEGDWLRAAEGIEADWQELLTRRPELARIIDRVRETAFRRSFEASRGHHDLAAMTSEDFEIICKHAVLGAECPFTVAMQGAYDAHRFPL